jgi:hypothetical protein
MTSDLQGECTLDEVINALQFSFGMNFDKGEVWELIYT